MAALKNAQVNANSMQRVKVYCLNEDGKWDDRGTGHVSMDYIERSEELGLYVIDEDDNATLLVHRISTEDIYRKQEDTIICWRDTERSTELALSFQETVGCCYVWDKISNMQQNLNFDSLNSETFHNVKSELRELPGVDRSTLPQILKIVTQSDIIDQMRLTELMLKDDLAFFQNLMNVFDMCEDLKDFDGLHMMFNIVEGIISLNSSQILEKILGDELFLKVIGCLEYDPSVPQPQHHRNYLKAHVVFKEAIPIENPVVLSKIHQTYRIGYLKDVVLTRVLDDAAAANLDSVLTENKATIVTLLKNDRTFFRELFARLRSLSTSVESRNDLVHFLHEFCRLSRTSLQEVQQIQLFRELVNDGIFEVIAEVLQSPDKKLVLTGIDILIMFLDPDHIHIRSYVARPESPLLGLLVKGVMQDFGDAMESQLIEFFRVLLDSSGGAKRADILDIFFDKHLPELVDFITASCPERPDDTSEGASRRVGSHCGTKPKVLLNICDLLCICFQQGSFRKNFLRKNMTEKVLLLTQRKEKFVVAAAIRVFRNLLFDLDDNVQSYVAMYNLMKPIIDVFVANRDRDNLLNSAVLELLEHIRKENATVLLKYVVDTFWDQFTPFEHLTSIKAFKTTYEECLEKDAQDKENVKENSNEEKSGSASNTQKEEEEEEEAKPNNSNVEAAYQSLRSGGLVDYEDEEDDEDLKPSVKKSPEVSDEERPKNKSPCRESEEDKSKRQKLCSTIESKEAEEDDKSVRTPSEMDVDGS